MKIGLLGFGSMGKTHAYCVENLKYFFSDSLDAKIEAVCTKNIENAKHHDKLIEQINFHQYTDTQKLQQEYQKLVISEIENLNIETSKKKGKETCTI
jgi:homoserine dehydrogenase